MGLYARQDSPFWWMLLERPNAPPLKRSTKIPRAAPDAQSRKDQRQQAEEIYRAAMNELARARYQLPTTQKTITFDRYADWYDSHHIAKHRGAERERAALKHLRKQFGTLDLAAISDQSVHEYETVRLVTAKPRTVNREVAILKSMLAAAVPKYLPASPLAGRKQLRFVPKKKRVLTAEEEARLLDQLPPRDRALYLVAVDTLIRLSNAVNLSRAEDKGTHLELVDSKTGPYDVPLSSRARAALDAIPNTGPYYFPHRRTAKNPRDTRGAIRRMLERACERCAPPIPYGRAASGITFHTATRATGATRMLRAGVDPKTVQEIGNWKSLEQMGDYLVTDMDRKRAAVERIAEITSQLRSDKPDSK